MNKFVWINPVVLGQYEFSDLKKAIENKGYQLVSCKQDHLNIVKDKYDQMIEDSDGCVIDMRCPAAADYVKKNYDNSSIRFSGIEPILIHCARELSEEYGKEDSCLYILTPCKELKELGDTIGLVNTRFLTWNDFVEKNQINLCKKQILKSPIPPGFFSHYKENGDSLKSKEEIDFYFQNKGYKDKKIVEMLYCKNGCHNGNGV